MSSELGKVGAVIDAFEYCPHHPEGIVAEYRRTCECLKPKPGMINSLVRRYPVDLTKSFLIGDKQSDMAAAAGLSGLLFSGRNVGDSRRAFGRTCCPLRAAKYRSNRIRRGGRVREAKYLPKVFATLRRAERTRCC